ncbi:MAG: hypothetical protein ACI93R_004081 [Flavobacteriales bacterium]
MLLIILTAVGFVLGGYMIVLAFLFIRQDKIIFQPPKPDFLTYKKFDSFTQSINTSDGIRLQGWNCSGKLLKNTYLIYFGGNAQDTCSMLPILESLYVDRVMTFNYRGYGLNSGIPSEKR